MMKDSETRGMCWPDESRPDITSIVHGDDNLALRSLYPFSNRRTENRKPLSSVSREALLMHEGPDGAAPACLCVTRNSCTIGSSLL